MKSVLLAIDGACKKPGTPECYSVGAYVIIDAEQVIGHIAHAETESTSQRGELIGLLGALDACIQLQSWDYDVMYIISDSEYIVNTINKEWYKNWENKGWITLEGTEVKNRDLWEQVAEKLNLIYSYDTELVVYHIKGHLLPFGKVTARNLITQDTSLNDLYNAILDKYCKEHRTRETKLSEACNRFNDFNNTQLDYRSDIFRGFVVANTFVDTVAAFYIEGIKQ